MPIVMPLFAIVLIGVPVATILRHTDRSRWWTVIAFIPLLNLIGLWVFALIADRARRGGGANAARSSTLGRQLVAGHDDR